MFHPAPKRFLPWVPQHGLLHILARRLLPASLGLIVIIGLILIFVNFSQRGAMKLQVFLGILAAFFVTCVVGICLLVFSCYCRPMLAKRYDLELEPPPKLPHHPLHQSHHVESPALLTKEWLMQTGQECCDRIGQSCKSFQKRSYGFPYYRDQLWGDAQQQRGRERGQLGGLVRYSDKYEKRSETARREVTNESARATERRRGPEPPQSYQERLICGRDQPRPVHLPDCEPRYDGPEDLHNIRQNSPLRDVDHKGWLPPNPQKNPGTNRIEDQPPWTSIQDCPCHTQIRRDLPQLHDTPPNSIPSMTTTNSNKYPRSNTYAPPGPSQYTTAQSQPHHPSSRPRSLLSPLNWRDGCQPTAGAPPSLPRSGARPNPPPRSRREMQVEADSRPVLVPQPAAAHLSPMQVMGNGERARKGGGMI